MSRIFSKTWLLYALLIAATALVWGQTIGFGFVWDDDFFIRDFPVIRSLKNIPAMFYQIDAQALRPHEFVIFRPIRTAHYALLYFLAGRADPQPWIFHLANVMWHGASAMMLFAALRLLFRRLRPDFSETESQAWAFLVALAFAVHPVVSEVVCWAKSLDDILATFFVLAAFRELLRSDASRAAYWRGIIYFALAVYSKESAVPFVLVPAIWFFQMDRLPVKKTIQRTLPFLLVAVIYILHRQLVIGRTSQTAPISGSYLQTLVDMFPVVPVYSRLLLGIPPFCIDYSYWHGGEKFVSLSVLAGLALLLAFIAAGPIAWRSKRFRLVGFGLLWTGLFLMPVSNLVPMMQYLAERFLYLPLIGWLIATGSLIAMIRKPVLGQAVWLCVVILWSITAWNRSWIWQDAITLFVRTSQECPKSQRVENNAVAAIFELPQITRFFHLENGKLVVVANVDAVSLDKVAQTFEEGLKLFPENHELLSALGVAYASCGQPGKAIPFFQRASDAQPRDINDLLNLSRAMIAANQWAAARIPLLKVLAMEPDNHFALAMMYEVQQRVGDRADALETARHWNRVAPDADSAAAVRMAEESLTQTNRVTAPENLR